MYGLHEMVSLRVSQIRSKYDCMSQGYCDAASYDSARAGVKCVVLGEGELRVINALVSLDTVEVPVSGRKK